jgi:hypothetical protein
MKMRYKICNFLKEIKHNCKISVYWVYWFFKITKQWKAAFLPQKSKNFLDFYDFYTLVKNIKLDFCRFAFFEKPSSETR